MVFEDNNTISVRRLKGQNVAKFNSYHAGFLQTDRKSATEEQDRNKDDAAAHTNDALDELLGLLPANIEEQLGNEFTEQLRNILHITSDQNEKNEDNGTDMTDKIDDQSIQIESQSNETNKRPDSTNS